MFENCLFIYKWRILWKKWEMLFILEIVVKNVDLVLNWLNCWDCSKYGNYAILLNELDIKVYIYIYIFILWNCVEKRIENFDHNGILYGTIEYGSNVALHY